MPLTMSGEDWAVAYTQGWNPVSYITGRFGRERRNAWLKAMAVGKDLDVATATELGVSFDQFGWEWQMSLRQSFVSAQDLAQGRL